MSNLIQTKLNSLQNQKSTCDFWNITLEQAIFLEKLIELKNPKRVLEIGTSNGFSTLYLAKNLNSDSIIDTIEVNQERFEIAKKNFDFCKLKNINQHLGDVFEILPNLNNKYDFIFIDSVQSRYLELIKLIESLNLLENDFTILFDNIESHKNMDEFLDFMKNNYLIQIISLGGGFLFVKSKNISN